MALRPDIIVTSAYLWLGDTVTVSAWAGTESRWPCYRRLYTNADQPKRFKYRSTDTSVATIDPGGFLVARRLGVTTLTATTAGVVSFPKLDLIIAPAVASLALTPTATTLTVGDTMLVRVEAFDGAGKTVTGARVTYGVGPDSIVRVVERPQPQAPGYAISTPFELRVHALRPGSAGVSAAVPRGLVELEAKRSIVLLVEARPAASR
jgi:hypothetical protein